MQYRQILEQVATQHSYEAGFNGRMAKYRWLRFQEYLPSFPIERTHALEIGCGEGTMTVRLEQLFDHVTALEPAYPFYEKACKRVQRAEVLHTMMEEFSPAISYECVVAFGVLEHVKDPAIFLQAVRQCMDDDGIFVLTVPNATSLHRRVGKEMGLIERLDELGPLDRKVGHFRYYDFPSLQVELECQGFEVCVLTGILLKPFPNAQMDTLSEAYCDALFALSDELPSYCAEIFCVAQKRER